MSDVLLDRGDVRVVALEPKLCEECAEAIATHAVQIDLRAIGERHEIGSFCHECATEVAERLSASLPPEVPS